eukprot:TRINITY_DN424_c0_g1_i2.p1 TRINITY_DN424_c0_g1~~TRINITY_DN424_c0_g1_i2.p1  ORF type:complete len:129 (-),score=15.27 TRINITY_DN424_c0_g1_i2:27-413(-)
MLACTLPKEKWTHEAHIASCIYLMLQHPEFTLETSMPLFISRYNVSVGVENTDKGGYHDTITQFQIRAIRDFLKKEGMDKSMLTLVNSAIQSYVGKRDFILNYWTKELLFSPEARKSYVEPNIKPVDF